MLLAAAGSAQFRFLGPPSRKTRWTGPTRRHHTMRPIRLLAPAFLGLPRLNPWLNLGLLAALGIVVCRQFLGQMHMHISADAHDFREWVGNLHCTVDKTDLHAISDGTII